jgi:Txe/YoeB family toxin of Txe-Axe toxin-antitoxin module
MAIAMTKRAYADLRQEKMVGDLYGADSRRIKIQQRLVDEVLPEQ